MYRSKRDRNDEAKHQSSSINVVYRKKIRRDGKKIKTTRNKNPRKSGKVHKKDKYGIPIESIAGFRRRNETRAGKMPDMGGQRPHIRKRIGNTVERDKHIARYCIPKELNDAKIAPRSRTKTKRITRLSGKVIPK